MLLEQGRWKDVPRGGLVLWMAGTLGLAVLKRQKQVALERALEGTPTPSSLRPSLSPAPFPWLLLLPAPCRAEPSLPLASVEKTPSFQLPGMHRWLWVSVSHLWSGDLRICP